MIVKKPHASPFSNRSTFEAQTAVKFCLRKCRETAACPRRALRNDPFVGKRLYLQGTADIFLPFRSVTKRIQSAKFCFKRKSVWPHAQTLGGWLRFWSETLCCTIAEYYRITQPLRQISLRLLSKETKVLAFPKRD